MFSAKGFVVGADATPYSGFAADATAVSNTAVSIAEPRRAVSSDELQTSVTEKLRKESLINVIASEPIAGGVLHFPLWIKVLLSIRILAASSRLQFLC